LTLHQATYFLHSKFSGQSIIESRFPPLSLAYFCPVCGDIWARVVVEGAGWAVEHAPCEKHKPTGGDDWGRVPGSLLLSQLSSKDLSTMWQGRAIENLPESLLARELSLHLKHFEESQNDNDQ